ncbi:MULTISPECIES: hypothetical protein [unclassified Nocardiopsis]|uniref:hypothetical protein n=1 Tax=Nocardiopsis TaxID=2013 RepID=UPI00387B53A5
MFEVRETMSRSALGRWAGLFGVPIHHLGSDIEGREVYGARFGPHLRVCRTAPERLHPVRWTSPLENLPHPRTAPTMFACPAWCENDHDASASDAVRHLRLLHDRTGHPVTVYAERDDLSAGEHGVPWVCLVTWVGSEAVKLRLAAAQARALAVLLAVTWRDGDVAGALTEGADLIESDI